MSEQPDSITINRHRIQNEPCDVKPCPNFSTIRVRTEYGFRPRRRTHTTFLCHLHARAFIANLAPVWP